MKINITRMIKNPARLAVKVFILIWFFLIVQIVLKVTFNYWQPYVIPTPQLQAISDFIDNNRWLEVIINGILYVINALLIILCGIREWWFKSKKQFIIILSSCVLGFIINLLFPNFVVAFIITIGIPLILKPKSWLFILLTFIISNVFQFLSLWLVGFTNANDMPYLIAVLLNNDYYILLAINYMMFNLIKRK